MYSSVGKDVWWSCIFASTFSTGSNEIRMQWITKNMIYHYGIAAPRYVKKARMSRNMRRTLLEEVRLNGIAYHMENLKGFLERDEM